MRLTNLPHEFAAALPVLHRITQAGYEAYFVGGCVRDTLLGIPLHDVDIASSAYPAEIKQIFHKTVDTGIEHGTVMVLDHGNGYEVTTFRTESTYQDFRRPDHVEFVRSLSEDLKRRDLTINALALSPNGEVIDHFNGLDDLKKRTITAVGDANERFHEDALRMMRAVRFASQLDFKLAPSTQEAIATNAALLTKIAVERIHVEFVKLMMGQAVKRGLTGMLATDLYKYCPQFAHAKSALEKICALPQVKLTDEVAVWTVVAWALDLTPKACGKLLRAWKTSNHIIQATQAVLAALPNFWQDDVNNLVLFNLGSELAHTARTVAALTQPQAAVMPQATLTDRLAALPITDRHQLKLDGTVLMQQLQLPAGRILGQVLSTALRAVVLGKVANDQATLLAWSHQYVEKISKD